jgi:hypothetical protein
MAALSVCSSAFLFRYAKQKDSAQAGLRLIRRREPEGLNDNSQSETYAFRLKNIK